METTDAAKENFWQNVVDATSVNWPMAKRSEVCRTDHTYSLPLSSEVFLDSVASAIVLSMGRSSSV